MTSPHQVEVPTRGGNGRQVSGLPPRFAELAVHPTVAPVHFDPELLYLALDRRRRRLGYTQNRVCREAGVLQPTFTRLGQGLGASVDTVARLLLWLGDTDLKPYLRTPDGSQ